VDGYRAVIAGQPIPKPNIVPGNPNPGGSGVSGIFVVLLIAAAAAVVVGAFLWYRSRKRSLKPAGAAADPNDPFPGVAAQELIDRANTLLIELDDALRTSERQLALASGEYGPEATASFTDALHRPR
jgi:uncharacterized membrane protein